MANCVADFCERNNVDSASIIRRARGGIHVLASGGIKATFWGLPAHTPNGTEIDTALQLDSKTGKYQGIGTPTIIDSEGGVSIDGQSWVHKSNSIGLYAPASATKTSATFASVLTVPTLASLHVKGAEVIRESGIYQHVMTNTETGFREVLVLSEMPKLSADSGDYLVIETQTIGETFADGELAVYSKGSYTFKAPRAWDSSGLLGNHYLPCKRWASDGRIYTGVSMEVLSKAVFPVYIDPDFSGGTADGNGWGQNATYSTARSTMYSTTNDLVTFWLGQFFDGTNYQVNRDFVLADTSSIDDAATITQANWTFTVIGDYSIGDFDVQIVDGGWSGTINEAAFDACLAASSSTLWRNTSGIVVNTPYTSSNLPTSGISKTGYTYHSLRVSTDYAGSTPATPEALNMASASNATTGYRPTLTVLYEIPASAYIPARRSLLGVGR